MSSTYLIVVPVPFGRVDARRCAIEGAFARHLQQLLASLQPRYSRLLVAAPEMSGAQLERAKASCLELDAERDGVSFTALRPASSGGWFALARTPAIFARLWSAVGDCGAAHAGPSPLAAPMENLALLVALLRGRRRVFVVDIDWRESARMNLATGAWSRGQALRTRYVHDVWKALQVRIARRTCHVVLLKGRKLVEDFGRGASNVHWFLDAAHSAELVLDGERARARREELERGGRPLRCVYFGRLTPYKGVAVMLAAIGAARARGADVVFDVFGDGEQLDELRAKCAAEGLAPHVKFRGARPYGPDFLAELDPCDLLLAAPLSEDTPRSALDAQARGIPILAFDTYYYRELEALGAGVACVAWRDVDAFAERLVRFATERSSLAALVERAVAFARDNTQEAWLARRAAWTLGEDNRRPGGLAARGPSR